MNEKYGIELELIMQKFNEKINKVKNAFKGIEDKKIDMSKQVKIDNLTKEFELAHKQAEMLRNKLKTLNAEMSRMQSWQIGTKPYVKLQNEIEKTNLQFEKASIKVDNLNGKLNALKVPNLSTGISESTSLLTKGLEKMTSKIKRFGLSLFSIRSIWALVSKASSAYLAQDTELADKLQSVWASLGAMLSPIIEGIANVLMKGVGYINIFIKALTSVDLLAKASAKSMDKAAKSAKGLNKSLAGFDELNNLDSDAGSNIDTGISNPFASIQNVDLPWAETIKAFGEWCKENLPTVIGLLGGVAAGITAIKSGLVGILATKFGTTILGVISGIILTVIGVIKLVGDLIEYLKDPTWKRFGEIITDIGLILLGVGIIIGGVPLIVAGVIAIIVGLVVSNWEKIKGVLQKGIEWIDSKMDWIGENFGFFGQWIAEIFKGAIEIVLDVFDGLFTGIKQIFDGILLIFKGDFKNGFINIGKGIVNILIGIINGAIAGINAILYPIRALIVETGKILGKNWTMSNISIPKIPLLDVGTNYVPEDQLAYIHKGEAVVPKKFNSQEYFGSGNEETNNLLEKVIEAINNIEVSPYTTIKDVGQTAVNYINGKARQYGRSVI